MPGLDMSGTRSRSIFLRLQGVGSLAGIPNAQVVPGKTEGPDPMRIRETNSEQVSTLYPSVLESRVSSTCLCSRYLTECALMPNVLLTRARPSNK